jgi:hypothetical protein
MKFLSLQNSQLNKSEKKKACIKLLMRMLIKLCESLIINFEELVKKVNLRDEEKYQILHEFHQKMADILADYHGKHRVEIERAYDR